MMWESKKFERIASATMAAVTIGFVISALVPFLAAGRDDTFIMLWAGQTFMPSRWFVNYNFEPQEIASSHLAAWIAAPTRWLDTGEALLFVKLTGLAASCITLCVIWSARARIFAPAAPSLYALAAILATAANPVFRYWTLGGLETPYHALFLTLFALALARLIHEAANVLRPKVGPLILWSSVLVLTRTEGFWPIAVSIVFLSLDRRIIGRLRLVAIAAGVPLVVLLLSIAVRWWFTGLFWPNPVYAKVAADSDVIPIGLSYLDGYFRSSPWSWIQVGALAVASVVGGSNLIRGLLQRRDSDSRWILLGVIGALGSGQSLFVLLSGGNWMEYYRFLAAVVPLLDVAVLIILSRFVGHLSLTSAPIWRAVAVMAAVAIALTQFRVAHSRDCATQTPLTAFASLVAMKEHVLRGNCAHGRDIRDTTPFIEGPFSELVRSSPTPVVVASGQAGFFPYYLRRSFSAERVPFIDLAGITEKAIAMAPARRSNYGVGFDLPTALEAGRDNPIGRLFADRPPTVIYRLRFDPRSRADLTRLGYELIWDRPGAVVFARQHGVSKTPLDHATTELENLSKPSSPSPE